MDGSRPPAGAAPGRVDGNKRRDDDRGRPARPGRWRRVLLIAVAVALAVLVLHGRLPSLSEVTAAVRAADPWWLLAGLGAEWVSMAMFARQQMWLLRGL